VGFVPPTAECCEDRVEYDRLTTVDIRVREAQHAVTAVREGLIPLAIGSLNVTVAPVLLAINLYDQPPS
jgi:hypothetical protein